MFSNDTCFLKAQREKEKRKDWFIFKHRLFILIGGQLLYNIVMVFAKIKFFRTNAI